MKKIISAVAAGIFILSGCSTNGDDKEPVVVCHKEEYVKASAAYRAAKGTFFTCGGPKCVVTETTKDKSGKVTLKTTSKKKYPQEFTISKSVSSWTTSNCGTIYRKRAK